MIDVLKRLAELDANKKHVVKENTNIEECGMMPMSSMGGSHTPASINMTADSGSELTGMLRDIMQLAGLNKVEPHHLGAEPAPMSLSLEPVSAVGPAIAEPLSGGDSMRSVLDKLNPEPEDDDSDLGPFQGDSDDEEPKFGDDDRKETDETVDSSPADPTDVPPVPANGMGTANQDQAGQPGVGDRNDGKQPKAFPTMEEQLMSEYKKFIGEDLSEAKGKKPDFLDMDKDGDKKEPMKKAVKDKKEVDESTTDILKLAGLK